MLRGHLSADSKKIDENMSHPRIQRPPQIAINRITFRQSDVVDDVSSNDNDQDDEPGAWKKAASHTWYARYDRHEQKVGKTWKHACYQTKGRGMVEVVAAAEVMGVARVVA